MPNTTPHLVWLDLEMTGLEPDTCAILEIGLIITDADLTPLAELAHAVWQPEEVLARMEPFVREMHTHNGLLDRVRASSITVRDAEREALALVSRHCRFREGILAGNSIHVDRRFLLRYMPHLEQYLHYRQVDVSTLKVLTQAWYPMAPHFDKPDKTHTALDDLRQSIQELAHYRRQFFRPPDER